MKILLRSLHLLIRKFFLSKFYTKTFGIVYLLKPHLFGDPKRLYISNSATINNAFLNTLSGTITINDDVFFGQNVSVLTGSHNMNRFGKDRYMAVIPKGNDITIERGVWVASNVTIIGPCIIGEYAVVAAGYVVTKNVPPYSVVAGVPAKVVKEIPRP